MLWGSVRLILALCLVVGTERSFVDTASLANPEHDPYQGNVHRNSWNLNPQSNPSSADTDLPGMMSPDQIVNQLKNLKPGASPLDLAYQNSRSEVFSNVNGQKESSVDTKEEVLSNGKKLQSVHVVGHSKDVPESATPSTHIHAEVEIPERGVHRTFDINSPQQNKRKGFAPVSRNEADENTVDTGYRSYSGVQYSPLDMAEYVFWTGDEKGVTLAIEEFLQDGLMTREEAISFLQDIKLNLDYLQTHYNEERFQKQQQAKERANQLQKVLNLDKMSESKMVGPSELSEVRQQMRDNLYKKSMETEEPTMNHGRTPSSTHSGSLGLSDDDYEDLLERLRVADFLYTEYSLEEVIYQLAKVMFSQSLTRGSSEAQEALQKFTGFLEVEAEQGRISRSLEKKVLDVLIASLTDTLSEHPELVSAARAGLGNGDLLATGRARNDPALQQLLLLNQDKSAADANKYSVKNHRFQSEGQTNAAGATADAGTAMKKSLPAASKPQTTP